MSISYRGPPQSIDGPTNRHSLKSFCLLRQRKRLKCTSKRTDRHANIISPVSVAIHECELKSNEAVQVRVIVPGRFVQKEDVPVRRDEHEAGETVETAQHDAQSTFNEKHKHTTSLNINNNSCCHY